MGVVTNRIDQSEYKKAKGITDKTYCNQCRRWGSSIMFMNTSGRLVCPECAGVEVKHASKASGEAV